MYICNCNGLNEQTVYEAIEKGAQKPAHIFKSHNCKPQCAKCVCEINEIIATTSQSLRIAAQ
jgi:bacterioferritin-associated ferredoxin